MFLKPFGNSNCYVTDEVSIIPAELSNLCQWTREKFVTDLAAVSRGKDESKNPPARFKALLEEAAPNKVEENGIVIPHSSRPMEFCPIMIEVKKFSSSSGELIYVIIDPEENEVNYDEELNEYVFNGSYMSEERFMNDVVRFSYITTNGKDRVSVYTNLRTLVNAGISYDEIPFIDSINYKIIYREKDIYISIGGKSLNISKDCRIPYYPVLDLNKSDSKPVEICFGIKDILSLVEPIDIINDYKQGFCRLPSELPYNNFKALKLKLPMFIWSQWPMTHTRLSKESQSDRVVEGIGYWLPDDIIQKIEAFVPDERINDNTEEEYALVTMSINDLKRECNKNQIYDKFEEYMTKVWSQNQTQSILKELGYKREIWSRAPYYFKLKEVVVTGWYNDPTTWKHSFLERSVKPELWKNWTQKETKQVMECVKNIIEKDIF